MGVTHPQYAQRVILRVGEQLSERKLGARGRWLVVGRRREGAVEQAVLVDAGHVIGPSAQANLRGRRKEKGARTIGVR